MKNGWEVKRLQEIADYSIGLTYSPQDVSDKGTIVLRSSNIQDDKLDLSDLVRVSRPIKEGLKVRRGDILMCSRNGSKRLVGKTAVIGDVSEEMAFGTFMTIIRGDHNPYLAWFFRSEAFRQQIGVGENTMINQITKYMLDAIKVPLPSRSEQQRIIGILENAFDSIAIAKANAEKNLQNVRALFESHLHTVFTQRGEGWVEKQFGEVCGFVRGPFGGSLKKSIFVPDGYAVYEQQHAIYDQFDDVRYFIDDVKFHEMKRFELLPNDLIMSCSGTMGRVAIVPDGIKRGIINQALLKLTPSSKILNSFLKYWMESEAFQDALLAYSGGAAIQNVASVKILKEIRVPLPPIKEQKSVVEKLESIQAETKRLESIFHQKLVALCDLKKSLLDQAFTGKL